MKRSVDRRELPGGDRYIPEEDQAPVIRAVGEAAPFSTCRQIPRSPAGDHQVPRPEHQGRRPPRTARDRPDIDLRLGDHHRRTGVHRDRGGTHHDPEERFISSGSPERRSVETNCLDHAPIQKGMGDLNELGADSIWVLSLPCRGGDRFRPTIAIGQPPFITPRPAGSRGRSPPRS